MKAIGFNVIRLATLAGLVAHFTLTVLYVLPLNPVRLTIEPLLQSTIGRFFSQNWSLFAPNPMSSTRTVMVRCLKHDEVAAKDVRLPTEGWADISSPLFTLAHRHRLSAYERLVRPQQNGVRGYTGSAMEFQALNERCAKGDKPICEVLTNLLKKRRANASTLLARLASVYCREAHPSESIDAVALRYRDRAAVPWSERFSGTPKTQDFELGVYPLDRTVTLPHLYLASEKL